MPGLSGRGSGLRREKFFGRIRRGKSRRDGKAGDRAREKSRSQRSLDSCEHTIGPEALSRRSMAVAEAGSAMGPRGVGSPPVRPPASAGTHHPRVLLLPKAQSPRRSI